MKKLLFFILFCSPVSIMAQPLSFTGIVSLKDTTLTKDELYARGVLWVTSGTFKSPGDILKMSDKKTGIIQGSGSMHHQHIGGGVPGSYASGYITFNFKLYVKDSKYKYEFSDFVHHGVSEGYSYGLVNDGECNKKFWKKYYVQIRKTINTEVASMLKSLESFMNSGVNNNW